MDYNELFKLAKIEAEWLNYYCHVDSKKIENFNYINFYENLVSIGYTKVVMPLYSRCAMSFIKSENGNTLDSHVEDLVFVSGPRCHSLEVYTPLEFIVLNKKENYLDLLNLIIN
jgi:hypothetical protein